MAKAKSNASDRLIETNATEGQSLGISYLADLHKDMIDKIEETLPSGDLRTRVLQAQQESFLFARLCVETNPKSFPDPKPLEMVEPEPEDPFAEDEGDAGGESEEGAD